MIVSVLAALGGGWMMTRRKSSTVTLLMRLNAALVSSSSPSAIPFSPSPLSLPSRLISTPRWSKRPSLGRAVDNTRRVITPLFRNTSSTSSLPSLRAGLSLPSEGTSWGVPSTGIECEMTWPEARTRRTVRAYRIWPLLYAARLSVPGSRACPPCSPCWAHEGSGMRGGRGMLNVCDAGNGCLLACPCRCPGCSSVAPASARSAGGGG